MDKENIVYQQRFQNACKTVDLVVYSKLKSPLGLERNPSKFVRKCLAKEKLKSLQKESTSKEVGMDRAIRKVISKRTKPVVIGKVEKTMKSRTYPVANQVTWGELLQQQNSKSLTQGSKNEYLQYDKAFPSKARQVDKQKKLKNDNNSNYGISSAAGHAEPVLIPSAKEMSKPLSDIDNNIKVVNDSYHRKLKRKSDSSVILNGDESAITSYREFHDGSKRISTIDKLNRVQSDQTHSPFGESAIQLLHQIQERLRSHGEDEDFIHMVSAIGAYLKTKKSENDSPTSLYPTVFSTPNPNKSEKFVEKGQQKRISELQQIVKDQDEKIQDQANVIQELRDLSAKLIEYHEQIHSKSDEDKNKILCNKDNELNSEVKDNGDQDVLTKLSFENQTLRTKVRSQLDFILKLELEVTNLRRQLKKSNELNEIKACDKNSFANIVRKPQRGESEEDSAFDEKSGSRTASGRSSVVVATSNYKSISVPRGLWSKSPSLQQLNSFDGDKVSKSSVDKSVPNLTAKNSLSIQGHVFKELNSFHIDDTKNDTLKGKDNDSLSFISDLTSYSNFTNRQNSCLRPDDNQIDNNFPAAENDKRLPALRYQYLESTHVDKGQKTGRISPSFLKPLKEIEMYSDDDSDESRVKLIPASVSCDNE